MVTIKRLNVSRYLAGRTIPFDRVYLARGTDARKALKRAFAYALIMPMTEGIADGLAGSLPSLHRTSPAEGRTSEWQEGSAGLLDEMKEHNDWLVVVPILPKIGAKSLPRYLTNKRWYEAGTRKRRTARANKTPLPVLSYLQTPNEDFRPVCIACPRFELQQAGECQFGQRICYDTLALGDGLLIDNEPPVTDFREDEVVSG